MTKRRRRSPFVLVLREQLNNGTWISNVWTGQDRYRAASIIAKHLDRTVTRKLMKWSAEKDKFVLDHYHSYTKEELAAMMRARFKQGFTKNAVIKRYHTLRGGR